MTANAWWDPGQRKWLRWDERRYQWRPLYPWWRQPAWWLVISASAGAVLGQYQAVRTWTPLQRAYVISYAWSAVAPMVGLTEGSYSLLHVRDRAGTHIAIDADVNAALGAADARHLQPSDAAVRAGARRLEWTGGRYPHALVYGFLHDAIYRDSSVARLSVPALVGAQVVLLVALLLSIAPRLWRWFASRFRRDLPSTLPPAQASKGPSQVPVDATRETPAPVSSAPATPPTATEQSAPAKPSAPPSPRPPTPFFE